MYGIGSQIYVNWYLYQLKIKKKSHHWQSCLKKFNEWENAKTEETWSLLQLPVLQVHWKCHITFESVFSMICLVHTTNNLKKPCSQEVRLSADSCPLQHHDQWISKSNILFPPICRAVLDYKWKFWVHVMRLLYKIPWR